MTRGSGREESHRIKNFEFRIENQERLGSVGGAVHSICLKPVLNAPTVALISFQVIASVGLGWYVAFDVSPSPAFSALYVLGGSWLLAAWVLADCRRLSIPTPLDLGWAMFAGWPLTLPYHLLRTRGAKRGCLAGLGFIAVFVACYCLEIIVIRLLVLGR